MPAAASTNQETWLDWMPPGVPEPELLSRDELLEALHARGVEITRFALEHYRRKGVLPRPVRRRHGGVTQAVYPAWFVPAIEHLKQMQESGKSLDDIKPWMRTWGLSTVSWKDPLAEPIANARAALSELLKANGIVDGGVLRVVFTDDDGTTRLEEEWPVTPAMLNVKT